MLFLHCDNTPPTTKKSLTLKMGGAYNCCNWKNMMKWCLWLPTLGHKVSTFASLSTCPYLRLCLFQTFPWNSALCCEEVWPSPPGEVLVERSWGTPPQQSVLTFRMWVNETSDDSRSQLFWAFHVSPRHCVAETGCPVPSMLYLNS